MQLNQSIHKNLEERVLAETDRTSNANDEIDFVDKCRQAHITEFGSSQQDDFVSRITGCMSNPSAIEVKTELTQKADFKGSSAMKEIARANVGEEATLESGAFSNKLKMESGFGALNFSENMKYYRTNEEPLVFSACFPSHFKSSTKADACKTKSRISYLDEKIAGSALSFKPVQASKSVNNRQHIVSGTMMHRDYYDRGKSGVFALRIGESPSLMQMYAMMRAARCSRLKLLGKALYPANRRGGLYCSSGFCRGWDGQIVVADGCNHRILVSDHQCVLFSLVLYCNVVMFVTNRSTLRTLSWLVSSGWRGKPTGNCGVHAE